VVRGTLESAAFGNGVPPRGMSSVLSSLAFRFVGDVSCGDGEVRSSAANARLSTRAKFYDLSVSIKGSTKPDKTGDGPW